MDQCIILTLIEKFTGQKNILTIPRILIDFTGSLESALFLNQLLYWNTRKKGEWLFKTYQEWEKEISLSEHKVRKAVNHLKEKGLIETKVKKARGNPTVHYFIKEKEFSKAFNKFLEEQGRNETEKSKERNCRTLRNETVEFKERNCRTLRNETVEFKELNSNINYNINTTIENINKKLLSNDNKVEKNNLVDNFSISNFNKDSLTRKIKKSLSDPEDYSEEVQSLFKFWQSLKIVNHKKSKSRNKALQDLDKALQKYSKEEIKKSMQAYKNLLNKCHNPIKSKSPYKIGLNEFFKFTKHTKDRIKKFHKDLQEMKSWFDLCLQDKDIYKEKFNGKIKDNYPLLTKKLIETIEGLSRKRKLDFDQENLCRKVSNVIYDLWSREYKNRKHFNLSARKYVMQFFSGYILPWIKKKANENEDFDIPWMLTTFFIDDINNICRKEIKRIKEEERAISFL